MLIDFPTLSLDCWRGSAWLYSTPRLNRQKRELCLGTIKGPDVKAKKENVVVSLTICGTFVTTLLSTLQTFLSAVLAAWFDENTRRENSMETGEYGRRFAERDRVCVSKILDVLRIRNRSERALGNECTQENAPR